MIGVMCAVACVACRQNCQRRSSDPYTPGSNKKNLLGSRTSQRDGSGAYAMVALDEAHGLSGGSDSEDPGGPVVARAEEIAVARVLDHDGEAAASSAAKSQQEKEAPVISTDFLAQDDNVDDWLQEEPAKKEKIKVDYSNYD